jgi:hypothetical protein
MNLKHDFLLMGLQKLHKVFVFMLLNVQVFVMVKLGLEVVVVGLGVVTM